MNKSNKEERNLLRYLETCSTELEYPIDVILPVPINRPSLKSAIQDLYDLVYEINGRLETPLDNPIFDFGYDGEEGIYFDDLDFIKFLDEKYEEYLKQKVER